MVIDKDFKNRAIFKQVPESEERLIEGRDDEFVIGKIYCKNQHCK